MEDIIYGEEKPLSFLKNKKLLLEMLRYGMVGAAAAIIDLAVLALFTELVFSGQKTGWPLTLSTAAGFIAGLIFNYAFSMLFVFTNEKQKEKNKKRSKTFLIFAIVGVIGLGLTELLMHLGMTVVSKEGFWYIVLSCFVKGAVLLWNYVGRKIFVYKGD